MSGALFYHMYPLGMTGAPKHNEGTEITHRFDELNRYIPHLSQLGFNAIYIGPLFESSSHGYDTRDYKLVDRRLGDNRDFKEFVALCHRSGIKVVVDGVFNHTGREFFRLPRHLRKALGLPLQGLVQGRQLRLAEPPGRSLRLRGLAGTLRTALPESV